jgi:hypothetical protein
MTELLRKAVFVRLTDHGLVIRWEGESEEGELYGLDDPILKKSTNFGPPVPGQPSWLESKKNLSEGGDGVAARAAAAADDNK